MESCFRSYVMSVEGSGKYGSTSLTLIGHTRQSTDVVYLIRVELKATTSEDESEVQGLRPACFLGSDCDGGLIVRSEIYVCG